MYLVKDISGAIGLMAAALVLLGTWPVVLAVLERRGRLPQHTYLDYSISNFLAAVLVAFTFGQIGGDTPETPNFLTQLTQDNWPSIMFAIAGGVFITLGTLATQYGWAYVGLTVTEVMASSLKVVIGTTLNYFLDGRINKAEVLFPGVGCFLIAACLGSLVHSSNAADNQEKLSNSRNFTGGDGNRASPAVVIKLYDKLSPEQRHAIVAMGQGNFLEIKFGHLHNPVISWFAQCYQPARRAFVVPCRGAIPLIDGSVYIMTGLPHGQLDVKYCLYYTLEAEIAARLFPSGSSRSKVSELATMTEEYQGADETFWELWILLIMSTIVAPTTHNKMSNRCYPMLADIANANEMNLSKFVADELHEHLSNSKFTKGCLLYCMLRYFDALRTDHLELELGNFPFAINEWSKLAIDAIGALDVQEYDTTTFGAMEVLGSNTLVGLGIVTFAGVCYSLFAPAFNLATNDQWHTLRDGVPHLVVYTAFFYFSLSSFVVGLALNAWFLYRPMAGVPRSSLRAYISDWEGRELALLAGMVSGLGNAFTFMAGQAAGYAAADSVQALPLVSTFWGVVLFGEYRRSSRRTYTLLASMLFMFVVAMAVLMASSAHRKPL